MLKSVIVGINAYHSKPLNGCLNDANDVIDYLLNNGLTTADQIVPLYDGRATKQAILSALQDKLRTAVEGDHVLFHFSGHGTRIPSSAHSDGYEEALVPFDFDWSNLSTFFTDSELAALTNTVPSGVAFSVVADACHSGGLSRDASRSPRFLPPPDDIAFMLRARKRLVTARDLSRSNAMLVAACQATEEASDTSFDGRPNGAFTYYWLKELSNGKASGVDELVTRVASNLSSYNMHPFIDGPTILRSAPFLVVPAPQGRDLTPPVITRGEDVFDQSWSAKVLGMTIGVELAILIANGGFDFQLSANAGVPLRWSFRVGGATSQRFDLGYGFGVVLTVSNWTATASNIEFDLGIAIAPPFFGQITITQQHVTLPASALPRALPTPTTAAELLALIQLAQLGHPQGAGPVPPPSAPRDPDQWTGIAYIENFAGGLFGCSYNKNSNDGGNTAYVPHGFIRDHVEVVLDPPNSGNVHFNGWLDSDPHIGGFEFHVGCSSCGGGRATFYLNCVPDPTVARHSPAGTVPSVPLRLALGQIGPAPEVTNGHAKLRQVDEDPFEMPQPEAGGRQA